MAPRIGIPQALTYHYRSTRVIERFLREAGAEVILSPRTTPEIHAAATTLGGADFCLTLRMLVGHVHHLVTRQPDLDFLLVPYMCSEDGERTTTCSKYRDAGGIAMRSLTSTLAYLLQHCTPAARRAAEAVFDRNGAPLPPSARFPVLLQPYVWSLEREPMFNVCFGLYCDVFDLPPAVRVGQRLVPGRLRRLLAPHLERCRTPFDVAYETVMRQAPPGLERLLAHPSRPRVALVGREYLLSEPLLTADLKAWFLKAGARVISPEDIRPEDLPPSPQAPLAFYDSHRHFDAFVEYVGPHVDGFIFAGVFGCRPDAFILDLMLDRVRRQGIPAWLFRFDELSGSAGFQTRYETVMRFLEQRRDRRQVAGAAAERVPATLTAPALGGTPPRTDDGLVRVPLIIWPYMSDHIEQIMHEIVTQAGLESYVSPPRAVSDAALALGSETFTESCCPYAFSTGSLMESLDTYLRTYPDGPPRRIVIFMARGQGPCAFGLYLPGQARDLHAALGDRLQRGGHTLEFATLGLSGATEFIRGLAEMGNQARLAPIVDYMRMRADGTLGRLPVWRRLAAARRLWRTIGGLLAPARAKLAAVERIRAQALQVRAHELTRGATTRVYRDGLARLAEAHSVAAVRGECARVLDELAALPQDQEIKPRVAVVGEIYVVQASFANRGVIDNLLARYGIEVVEGTTLSSLIDISEREMLRRAWVNTWPLRPVLQTLWRHNILIWQAMVEGVEARPFMNVGVGGEGNLSVAAARRLVEEGADGVVHLMPFKCMPESIAKAPMAEMCRLYGVPYLPLSFNRELEIERVKTEIATFAALLHGRTGRLAADGPRAYARARGREIARRRVLGRAVNQLHRRTRRRRFAVL
jgi:predicted nucleotide-binding protein (sugar kinase/HSP70/actin superfamily)